MKNSKKYFWIVLGVLVAIPVICLIAFKITVFNNDTITYKPSMKNIERGDLISIDYDYTDFDSIEVEGAWKVIITSGDGYSIKTDCYENYAEELLIEKRGKTLYIGSIHNRKNYFSPHNPGTSVNIVMPKLIDVCVEGGVDMELKDFYEEKTNFQIDGAANIVGLNCKHKEITINTNGAANFNFKESEVINADVNISGAANIEINMAGGDLTGKLSGIGNISYSGKVGLVDVKKDGLGVIERSN